jgi:hypothetical protein
MARKPVHLMAAGGKPNGRQGIWEAIRADGEAFTVASLAAATDIHRDTIRTYLRGLEAAGYIGRQFVTDVWVYQLVKDVGIEAPRVTRDGRPVTQGAAREQMWRTMKMLAGDWSWRDLAIAASTEAVVVAEAEAKDYCANLAKAGYLAVAASGRGAGKAGIPTRYRFVRAKNTGPRPPMVQRVNAVYDANQRRVVWFDGVRDDG